MRNKRLFISVIIITFLLIVAGVLLLLYYLNKEEEKPEYVFNFTDVEYPYGFKWGMSLEEVEDQILAKGLYTKIRDIYSSGGFLTCEDNNFQNNIGFKSTVIFSFNEQTELDGIIFKISFDSQKLNFAKEDFINAYHDELSKVFGPIIDYVDPFLISHGWYNEETVITLAINDAETEYKYFFYDVQNHEDIVNELELLR